MPIYKPSYPIPLSKIGNIVRSSNINNPVNQSNSDNPANPTEASLWIGNSNKDRPLSPVYILPNNQSELIIQGKCIIS